MSTCRSCHKQMIKWVDRSGRGRSSQKKSSCFCGFFASRRSVVQITYSAFLPESRYRKCIKNRMDELHSQPHGPAQGHLQSVKLYQVNSPLEQKMSVFSDIFPKSPQLQFNLRRDGGYKNPNRDVYYPCSHNCHSYLNKEGRDSHRELRASSKM